MALILDKEIGFNVCNVHGWSESSLHINTGGNTLLPNCTEQVINTCSIVIHVMLPMNEVW